MRKVEGISELRGVLSAWRKEGQRIAFVPTMGNLHAGHYSLIHRARRLADRVVASIFVNPSQFGPNHDLDSYPRTPQADFEGLRAARCDLLFQPSVETVYPFGVESRVRVAVPGITGQLCGSSRPGHFDGVATVVSRLFNMVQPDVAVFGEKDYQQLAVIRYLVRDLAFPVDIVGAPTQREADGLALSSRNQYLTPEQRQLAPTIHDTLRWMAEQLKTGRPISEIEHEARSRLDAAGFEVDYASVRNESLAPVVDDQPADARVILIAARLGRTRLIDNLRLPIASE